MQKEKWKGDNIPPNYYCQVLHYMNVTGYTFARLFAELIYDENYQVTKTYTIDINDENVKEDLKALQDAEIRFWKYVEDGETPPLVLPNL
jgi:predicted phage-related endonuclease